MSPDEGSSHEPEQHPASYRVEPEPPSAKEKTSRWPGWIWSIPIAAVVIVGWLAFKQLATSGPSVTVTFDSADGVQAGNTQVKYEGMQVGEVEAVHLAKDLRHVNVRLQMNAEMDGHLGPGTEFWIAGANPNLGDLSSLRSIIAGPYIGMAPKDGDTQDHFTALAQPPVLPETVPGRHFVLTAEKLGNISRGTTVYYKGVDVGSVETTDLQPDRSFRIGTFVKSPYDSLVHTGTRFWNAGAVQLSVQDSGPQLQVESLPAVLGGAISFETPSAAESGGEAPEKHSFKLFQSHDAAEYAPGPKAVTYRVSFDATGGGLSDYAAVELAGQRIGSVQTTDLLFDPDNGTVQEQATLALEPSKMHLTGGQWTDPRKQMDTLLDKLVAKGLRAQLGSSIPLVGAKNIELAFVAGQSQTGLTPGNPPEIPSQSGGGVSGILAAVNKITGKLDSLPIDQIAENIKTITARAAALAQSPETTQALQNLDQSVSNIESLTADANKQVPKIIDELRKVATEAESTIRSAQSLINNQSGVTATGLQTAGLSQTLYELSQAARAVRQLADYLDQHPSALIRGKG